LFHLEKKIAMYVMAKINSIVQGWQIHGARELANMEPTIMQRAREK